MDSVAEPFPPPLPPRPASTISPGYRPLSDKGEIRLLLLQPASSLKAPVVCSIQHAFLSACPPFEAVSYCWGTKGAGGNILLDGRPFGIYENAKAALRRLRRPAQPRLLWMDAICINQDDATEKNIQVPLMGSVYAHAEQVLVWRSEEKDDLLATVLSTVKLGRNNFANDVSFSKRMLIDTIKGMNHVPGKFNLLKVLDGYRAEEVRHGEIRELLSRPWWSRVWTIQEAVVAKKLLVVCGSQTFKWDVIQTMVESSATDWGIGDTYNLLRCPEEPALHARLYAINRLRKAWAKDHGDIRLIEVLFRFRELGATDPRDRIYAFLGLLRDSGGSLIAPEYGAQPSDIYTSATRKLIEHRKSLDILSCVREWRGVGKKTQQAFAYSCFDQVKYHDPSCLVKRDGASKPSRDWARLPTGWERVSEGDTCYYYDHNSGTKQDVSPWAALSLQRGQHPIECRICPTGWSKTWDNLGRAVVRYDPNNTLQDEQVPGPDPVVQGGLLTLPSWVPNWALKTHLDPELLLRWSDDGSSLYNACGDLSAAVYAFPDAHTLGLEGACFDEVAVISAPWHPETINAPLWRRAGDTRETWVPLATAAVPNCPYLHLAGGREEAMLLTHLADDGGDEESRTSDVTMVRDWLNPDKKFSEGPDVSSIANMGFWAFLGNLRKQCWQVVKTPPELKECVERIHKATSHRAMFVTKRGFMGLAPWNAKVGDGVCVFKGGKTPFLLRPSDSEVFSLVGEVFVYGIMVGGALSSTTPTRMFNIR